MLWHAGDLEARGNGCELGCWRRYWNRLRRLDFRFRTLRWSWHAWMGEGRSFRRRWGHGRNRLRSIAQMHLLPLYYNAPAKTAAEAAATISRTYTCTAEAVALAVSGILSGTSTLVSKIVTDFAQQQKCRSLRSRFGIACHEGLSEHRETLQKHLR